MNDQEIWEVEKKKEQDVFCTGFVPARAQRCMLRCKVVHIDMQNRAH